MFEGSDPVADPVAAGSAADFVAVFGLVAGSVAFGLVAAGFSAAGFVAGVAVRDSLGLSNPWNRFASFAVAFAVLTDCAVGSFAVEGFVVVSAGVVVSGSAAVSVAAAAVAGCLVECFAVVFVAACCSVLSVCGASGRRGFGCSGSFHFWAPAARHSCSS